MDIAVSFDPSVVLFNRASSCGAAKKYVGLKMKALILALLISGNLWTSELDYSSKPPIQTNQVIVVGGGNVLDNSQSQIEENVNWLMSSLRTNAHVDSLSVFFGSGNAKQDDIIYAANKSDLSIQEYVKQRVNNIHGLLSPISRHNRFTTLSGSTYKDILLEKLSSSFAQSEQNLLFIYNGHGGRDYDNEQNNYLKLWGDGKLTIDELSVLVQKNSKHKARRFIFTQCFSGAFQELIKQLQANKDGSQNCAFYAESAFREAEGCSLDTDISDFRDYSSYFFAALLGSHRNGSSLLTDPDINNDSSVSFYEAHLYTLKHAQSIDLSRSSSEVFLEEWQPWYLRWNVNYSGMETFSEYWQLAKAIADKLNIRLDKDSINKSIYSQKMILIELKKQIEELEFKIGSLQSKLNQTDLNDMFQIERILLLEDFIELEKTIEALIKTKKEAFEVERIIVQHKKIERFKRMSVIENQFKKYASSSDKAQFDSLRSCEMSAL